MSSEVELTWIAAIYNPGRLAGRQMLGPTSESKQDSSLEALKYMYLSTRQLRIQCDCPIQILSKR